MIFNGDCLELLDAMAERKIVVPMMFADPPDALGLKYDGYTDFTPSQRPEYYTFLEAVITKSLLVTKCLWFSYYWQHDLEIKFMVRNLLKFRHPSWSAKTFLWAYNFGQHVQTDCGSGFRYVLRLSSPDKVWNTNDIRIESERQRMGDKRACPDGAVPLDVWEIPRVTGNSHERRSFHPTQHPELLYDRAILMSSNKGDTVIDLFGGTGTLLRCCKRLDRRGVVAELSNEYATRIAAEHGCPVVHDPGTVFGP